MSVIFWFSNWVPKIAMMMSLWLLSRRVVNTKYITNAIVELNKGNALMKVFRGQQSHFYYLPYRDDITENSLSKIRQKSWEILWWIKRRNNCFLHLENCLINVLQNLSHSKIHFKELTANGSPWMCFSFFFSPCHCQLKALRKSNTERNTPVRCGNNYMFCLNW